MATTRVVPFLLLLVVEEERETTRVILHQARHAAARTLVCVGSETSLLRRRYRGTNGGHPRSAIGARDPVRNLQGGPTVDRRAIQPPVGAGVTEER